jgi:hypothetical protein
METRRRKAPAAAGRPALRCRFRRCAAAHAPAQRQRRLDLREQRVERLPGAPDAAAGGQLGDRQQTARQPGIRLAARREAQALEAVGVEQHRQRRPTAASALISTP